MSLPTRIALHTSSGRYVTYGDGILITANRTSIQGSEIFILHDFGNNQVALELSGEPDCYISAATSGAWGQGWNRQELQSALDSPPANNPAVLFTLVDLGYGRIALKKSDGQYLACTDGILTHSSTTIGANESFGMIDMTIPAAPAPTIPNGTPLILGCSLNGVPHLLQYIPATGYVYGCKLSSSELGTPMLLNRANPCLLNCTSIALVNKAGTMALVNNGGTFALVNNDDTTYLFLYRSQDGQSATHAIDAQGLGPKFDIGPFYPGASQVIAVNDLGVTSLMFCSSVNETGYLWNFDPGASPYARGTSSADSTLAGRSPIVLNGLASQVIYSRATGLVSLWATTQGAVQIPILGVIDRSFNQMTSVVGEGGVAYVAFMRAGSTAVTLYRIGAGSFDQQLSLALPPVRMPTLRLRALQANRVMSLGPDGTAKLSDGQPDKYCDLELLPDANGAFRMRSFDNRLLCVDSYTIKTCPDTTRDATSLFQMVPAPGARFRLRASDGTFVAANSALTLSTHRTGTNDALTPDILFQWDDYGVGGGNPFVDKYLGQGITPPVFANMVPIHSEYDADTDTYGFSTRSANEAALDGVQSRETLFHAFATQQPFTMPVRIERKVNGERGYHLSLRDPPFAAQWGYQQTGILCWVYAMQRPGTVPVYRECKIGAPTKYNFSTRSARRAAEKGWQQLDVAFYARPPVVPVYSANSASTPGFCFSTADAAMPAGFQGYDVVFCAYGCQLDGTVPVYLEQKVNGDPGYHLSTRDAQTAAQWGYKQLGIACYAFTTPQPGTVPIHRELKNGTSSQYYFSMRSADEAAANGNTQLDVAFHAYVPGPYITVRSQLIDTSLGQSAQPTPGYRVVLDCRGIPGQPIQSALTLRATVGTVLELDDGSTIPVGPQLPITRSTSTDGQLSFIVRPNNQLIAPVIKVRADFMFGTQVLAIAPDQNAHRDLASLDVSTLSAQLGNRPGHAALIKSVMGGLARSLPVSVSASGPGSGSMPLSFGWLEDTGQAIGNFFTNTLPSIAKDGVHAIQQAVEPAYHAAVREFQQLVDGVNRAVQPGGQVMVALQGIGTQVQALVINGADAAQRLASQLSAGVNFAVQFTTAIFNEVRAVGERAFRAFIIDTGGVVKLLITSAQEAAKFIVNIVQQAGKLIDDLLKLVTASFGWDDIFKTQQGMESCIDVLFNQAQTALTKKFSADTTSTQGRAQLFALRQKVTGGFDSFINSLPNPVIAMPPAAHSLVEQFSQLTQRGLKQLAPQALAVAGNTSISSSINLSGLDLTPLDAAVRDPMAIIEQGPKLLLQASQLLVGKAFDAADLLLQQMSTLIGALGQAVRDGITAIQGFLNAPLNIPVLSDLYRTIQPAGSTPMPLTLRRLITLLAAVMAQGARTGTAASRGPIFTQAHVSSLQSALAAHPVVFAQSDGPAPKPPHYYPCQIASNMMRAVLAVFETVECFLGIEIRKPFAAARAFIGWLVDGLMPSVELNLAFETGSPIATPNFAFLIWLSGIVPVMSKIQCCSEPGYAEIMDDGVVGLYGLVKLALNIALWKEMYDDPSTDRDDYPFEGTANLLDGIGSGLLLTSYGYKIKHVEAPFNVDYSRAFAAFLVIPLMMARTASNMDKLPA